MIRKVITLLSIGGLMSLLFSCTPRIGAEVTKGEIPSVAQITSKFSPDQLETGKSIWQVIVIVVINYLNPKPKHRLNGIKH